MIYVLSQTHKVLLNLYPIFFFFINVLFSLSLQVSKILTSRSRLSRTRHIWKSACAVVGDLGAVGWVGWLCCTTGMNLTGAGLSYTRTGMGLLSCTTSERHVQRHYIHTLTMYTYQPQRRTCSVLFVLHQELTAYGVPGIALKLNIDGRSRSRSRSGGGGGLPPWPP